MKLTIYFYYVEHNAISDYIC